MGRSALLISLILLAGCSGAGSQSQEPARSLRGAEPAPNTTPASQEPAPSSEPENNHDPVVTSTPELVQEVLAAGVVEQRTCGCVAAGATQELTEDSRRALYAEWTAGFGMWSVELVTIGCSHISFEMALAQSLSKAGLAPVRPGPDGPGIREPLGAMRALPTIDSRTDDQGVLAFGIEPVSLDDIPCSQVLGKELGTAGLITAALNAATALGARATGG